MAIVIAFTKFPVHMLTIAILPATSAPSEAPEKDINFTTERGQTFGVFFWCDEHTESLPRVFDRCYVIPIRWYGSIFIQQTIFRDSVIIENRKAIVNSI